MRSKHDVVLDEGLNCALVGHHIGVSDVKSVLVLDLRILHTTLYATWLKIRFYIDNVLCPGVVFPLMMPKGVKMNDLKQLH